MTTGFMKAPNLGDQSPVLPGTATLRPMQPIVVATGRDRYELAHPANLVELAVCSNKCVLHLSARAKYAADFFKISTSSFKRLFSCLSVVSSL